MQIPSGQELIQAVKDIATKFGHEYWPGIFEPGYESQLEMNYFNWTNFTGETLDPDQVKDITPRYEDVDPEIQDYYDWVDQQVKTGDVFYYANPREHFHPYEAFSLAAKLGKHKVILEDMS